MSYKNPRQHKLIPVLTIIRNRTTSTWLDTSASDKTQWLAKLLLTSPPELKILVSLSFQDLLTSLQNSRPTYFYPSKTSTTLFLPNFSVQSLHTSMFFALASSTSLPWFRFPRHHILLHPSSMQRRIHSINPAVISLLYHPKQPDRYLPMHLMHNQSKPLLKRR
jgi:hypothetical protein